MEGKGEGPVEEIKRTPASPEDLTFYLMKIRNEGWLPNFFTSVPHLLSVKADIVIDDMDWMWASIEDGVTSAYLPPVHKFQGSLYPDLKEIWSDFSGWTPPYGWTPEFLDWEYLYSPLSFQEMSGKKWETFRKNSRKWVNRNGPVSLTCERLNTPEAEGLIGGWLDSRGDEDIYDVEAILDYLLNGRGNTGVIRDSKGGLLSILGWDENWKYINFRYLIVRPGEPFLDELSRLTFYQDQRIHRNYKLVNDGGTLGSESLEQFKDKLNPLHKRKVYTWKNTWMGGLR